MPPVFAQSVVEYVGVSGAPSAMAVVGEQFNRFYNTVSNSVSDHPVLWGAGLCVAAWLLIRRR